MINYFGKIFSVKYPTMRGCVDAHEPAKYAERRSRADQAKTIWQGKVNKNLNKQKFEIS